LPQNPKNSPLLPKIKNRGGNIHQLRKELSKGQQHFVKLKWITIKGKSMDRTNQIGRDLVSLNKKKALTRGWGWEKDESQKKKKKPKNYPRPQKRGLKDGNQKGGNVGPQES